MGFSFHSFDHQVTPSLFDACGLWVAEALTWGGLGTWARSKLSAHVSTHSSAVKRAHCEEPPQEAEQNEHGDLNWKECKRLPVCNNHTYDSLDWLWLSRSWTYHRPKHSSNQNHDMHKLNCFSEYWKVQYIIQYCISIIHVYGKI